MVDHSSTQDESSNLSTSTITISKEFVLFLLYYEQMWKTVALTFAIQSAEAQQLALEVIQQYKERFPSPTAFNSMLEVLLKDESETLNVYRTLLNEIKSPSPVITDVSEN